MKKLILVFALFALFSCNEESEVEPYIEYNINGIWTGKSDFIISQFSEPGEMDIEIILTSDRFTQFSYDLLLDGVYIGIDETYNDGTLTRTGNSIYIEIFKTSKDGTMRAMIFTFNGKISNGTITGELLLVSSGNGGNFILRK